VRTVVLLLVIANLAWWGAAQLDSGVSSGGEPERLAQQIEPERLRIVARGDPPPATAVAAAAKAEAAAAAVACLAYGGLTEELADAIVPVVTRRAPELMVARDRDDIHVSGHRVQINRLGSRAVAERKARELRELGVDDHTIVGSGGNWVVSLGVFASESAARARLAELRRQGVRSADVQAITYPDTRARVTVSGPAEAVARATEAVRQSQPELEGEVCVPLPAEAAGAAADAKPS
jgi:hypothetical protein